jgi:large subunit ribosomal protein L13
MLKIQKSYMAKSADVNPDWRLIDADNKVLGKLATEIATILQGKHRPTYTPHIATGDFVVVINAEKIHVSGDKANTKIYYRHTGYPGGLREKVYSKLQKEAPEQIIIKAVQGMLPKNKLRQVMLRRLKVYSGLDHPHAAQIGIAAKQKAAN